MIQQAHKVKFVPLPMAEKKNASLVGLSIISSMSTFQGMMYIYIYLRACFNIYMYMYCIYIRPCPF